MSDMKKRTGVKRGVEVNGSSKEKRNERKGEENGSEEEQGR